MPVRVVAWNLKDFGTRYIGAANPIPAMLNITHSLHLNALAKAITVLGADVLVIQEFHRRGTQLLVDLVQLLNGFPFVDWCYDYIPGAIIRNAPPQLGYSPFANLEGYAVVFRRDALIPQNTQNSQGGQSLQQQQWQALNAHYIDLVTNGKPLSLRGTYVDNPIYHVYSDMRPYTFRQQPNDPAPMPSVNLGFPFGQCSWLVPDTPLLNVPPAAARNRNIFFNTLTRRPCHIRVNRDFPNQAGAPPNEHGANIVVYHAPNGFPSSTYATLIGCASSPLHVTWQGAPEPAAYLGDFNLVSAPGQRQLRFVADNVGLLQNTFEMGNVPPDTMVLPFGENSSPRDYGMARGTSALSVDETVLTQFGTAGSLLADFFIENYFSQAQPNNNVTPGIRAALAVQNERFYQQNATTLTICDYHVAQTWQGPPPQIPPHYAPGEPAWTYPNQYPPDENADTASALLFNFLLSDHKPVVCDFQ